MAFGVWVPCSAYCSGPNDGAANPLIYTTPIIKYHNHPWNFHPQTFRLDAFRRFGLGLLWLVCYASCLLAD